MSNISMENKIATIMLVLSPVLNTYQSPIPNLGMGEFSILVMFFFLLPRIIKTATIRVYKYHYFVAYSILISFFTLAIYPSYNAADVIARLGMLLIYTIIIFSFGGRFFEFEYGLMVYKKVALLCAAFVYFQTFVFYLFGKVILGIIPGIPLNYSIDNYSDLMGKYVALSADYLRPAGFFPEPAYAAQYMSIALLLILFTNHKKGTYLKAVFITGAILLTTSANGMVVSSFIWLVYIVMYTYYVKSLLNLLKIFGISTLILLSFLLMYERSPVLQDVFERVRTIGDDPNSSSTIRVVKGFLFFQEIGPIEKIFGIGCGTYYSYIATHTVNIPDVNSEYMNSMSYWMTSTGLLGFSLLMISFRDMVKANGKTAKVIILTLLLYSLSSSIFCSPMYALMLCFALKSKNEFDEF